jgi:DNA-binding response OmpR family regulator
MLHIAIIDDDPEVVDLLVKWLADIVPDHTPHRFLDLAPALEAIASNDFDLVISDVELGDGDKYGGVKIAKALDMSRTPLLVISGYSVHEGVFKALDAWDFLEKPLQEPDFKNEVKRALVYRKGLTDTSALPEGRFERVPDLVINRRSRRGVQWKGDRIHLPMSKIDIVEALASRAGSIVSHKDLFEFLPSGKNKRNLRVAISEIRDEFRTVDEDFDNIKPVVMSGYMWRTE